jgi:hypothetical protein
VGKSQVGGHVKVGEQGGVLGQLNGLVGGGR